MADIVDFPFKTLVPVEIGIDAAWNSRSGGEGMNGVTQIVSPLTALWEMSVLFNLTRESQGRAWRAVKMEMKGRYGWVRFPIFDPWRVRLADAGWPPAVAGGIPHSDVAFFSDDSGYAYPDITTTVKAAGEIGDEEITLAIDDLGDALGAGHVFSINDFLYLVIRRLGEGAGVTRTFRIGPPLRADVAVGDVVQIGRPTILCRLVDDRSGAIRMKWGRFGEPSMEFVEVLERDAAV